MVHISYIKVIRINITPYLSQKLKKCMNYIRARPYFYRPLGRLSSFSRLDSDVVLCGSAALRGFMLSWDYVVS